MRTPGRLLAVLGGALVGSLAIGGCAPTGDEGETITPEIVSVNPELATDPDVPVVSDLLYGTAGGTPLLLDACLPPNPPEDSGPRPAILVIHGGSWARGDKADIAWRAMCQWLAKSGYPAFSVNYRLVPAVTFPAAFQDVSRAVLWLRDAAQVERFDIDPERIGVLGGSAGGNLAALLGTAGSGDLTSGSRVAAVAELSGPVDLTGAATTDDFLPVQLRYLGCASVENCPAARNASPRYAIDPTDADFFVAHSVDEFIPIEQSEQFVADLRAAGIDVTFIRVEGTLHSVAMISADLKSRILDFFESTLGSPPEAGTP